MAQALPSVGDQLDTTTSSTTIDCLPPETLGTIFTFTRNAYAFNDRHHDTMGWIKATTHVCRTWRQIALGMPALWALICIPAFPGSVGWTWIHEQLRRAERHATVSLSMDLADASTDNIRFSHADLKPMNQLSKQYLPRMSSISIREGSAIEMQMILHVSTEAATPAVLCLDTLVFTSTTTTCANLFVFSAKTIHAPQLRRLALAGNHIAVDWSNAKFLHKLTHLSLFHLPGLNLPELLVGLVHLLHLEVLDVQCTFRWFRTEVTQPPIVQLPQLRTLCVQESYADMIVFLSNLVVSRLTRLKLQCEVDPVFPSPERPVDLMIGLVHQLNNSSQNPRRQLYLIDDEDYLQVQAWTKVGDPEENVPSLELLFGRFNRLCDSYDYPLSVAEICSAIDIRELEVLETHLHSLPTGTWKSTFGSLSKLHTITTTADVYELLPALFDDIESAFSPPQKPQSELKAPFPALKTLEFLATNFDNIRNPFTRPYKQDFVDSCLTRREEMGAKIPFLELYEARNSAREMFVNCRRLRMLSGI